MYPDKISIRLHLLTSKTYADGSSPIILTYLVNGKRKKVTIYKCNAKDWDPKTSRVKPKVANSAYINAMISEKYNNAEQEVLQIKQGVKDVDDLYLKTGSITLSAGFELELKRLEREFKAGFYDKILAIQKQLSDQGNIKLSKIDKAWFENLVVKLKELGNNGTTIKKKIKLIRGVIGRYSEKNIPKEVKEFSVPMNKSLKQKLTPAELEAIEKLPLPDGEMITATRDLFLLQVYLRGIRVGDLLQASSDDFDGGRFVYRSDKTDTPQTIKLIPKAILIVDKYKSKHDKLFPFFTWSPDKALTEFQNKQKRLKAKELCTTVVNKYLKIIAGMAGIKKPLSSHIARHTFARMAIDKINNPMVTMELLGHSSLAVHQAYLNDIKKDDVLDSAADDIFG